MPYRAWALSLPVVSGKDLLITLSEANTEGHRNHADRARAYMPWRTGGGVHPEIADFAVQLRSAVSNVMRQAGADIQTNLVAREMSKIERRVIGIAVAIKIAIV